MSHAKRRRLHGPILACGCWLWAASIHAQPEGSGTDAAAPTTDAPKDEQARAHFKVGQSLYAAGRFDEAAEEWREAYELSRQPELLYNMYLAYRDGNASRKAADALRGYLEKADSVPSDLRVTLEARLRVMEQSLREREARAAQGSEGGTGEERAPSSEDASLRVPPRRPAGSEPEPTPLWREITPWAVAGVGGAMVLAGVFTGVAALHRVDDIEEACPDDRCPPGFDLDEARGNARALVTATDVLIIGGGLVAAGGVGWLLWDASQEGRQSERPRVSLGCSSYGCAASVGGRF